MTKQVSRRSRIRGVKGVLAALLSLLAMNGANADLPLDQASTAVKMAWQQCFAEQGRAQACIDDLYASARDYFPDKENAELSWGEYQYLLALLQRAVRQRDSMGETVGALVGWKQHAQNAMEAFRQQGDSQAAMWAMVLYIEGELSLLYGEEGDQKRQQAVQAFEQLQALLKEQSPALLEYYATLLAQVHPMMDAQARDTAGYRYYQQAESYAFAAGAWDRVVLYRLMLDNLDTHEDRQDAIADFALEKGLQTRAVAVLVQASRILETGVQNFDSPEIALARKRLERGCAIASSDLEQFLCLFYRGQMAVRLGNDASAAGLVAKLDDRADVLADPAWLNYLNVNELASTLSRIAYQSGDDAEAASLMSQFVEALLSSGQPPASLGNEIYNLALFRYRSGADPLALKAVQTYLEQDSISESSRDDFHHLAAAQAYRQGDLETAIRQLSKIAGDSYLGLSGYFRARLLMLQALGGDSEAFLQQWAGQEFYSLDYALRESALALLEVREDEGLVLSVKGDLFPLFPRGRWFVSFAQSATAAATHLVAVAGDTIPAALPELVVDAGSEQSGTRMLALTSDGKTAVVCATSKTCAVRESETGRLLRSWQVGDVNQAFLADDNVLVTHYALGNGTLKLWSLDSGDMLASYSVASSVGNTVYDVPGDSHLILVNEKIDVLNYRERRIEKTLDEEVFHRFVSHADKQIVNIQPGRSDGEVLVSLVSGKPGEQYGTMNWQDAQSHFVWWSVTENVLSAAAPSREGHWWAERSPSGVLRLHQQLPLFSEAVPLLIVGDETPRECPPGCLLAEDFPGLGKHQPAWLEQVRQASAARGGRMIMETEQGATQVVELATGRVLGAHAQGAHRTGQTVVSDDGDFIISLLPGSDEVAIWSARRGREIRRLQDHYARGLQWIDDRLWGWQGNALMWLSMAPGSEWHSLDIVPDEQGRFPAIEQLIAVPGESRLRMLESVYLSEEQRQRYQVRQIQRDGTALTRLPWSFVDADRAHGFSPPRILPGAATIAYFSDEKTLTVASLEDGQVVYSAQLQQEGGELVPLGQQALAILHRDGIDVHHLATRQRWASNALMGQYRSVALDASGKQVWVSEDLGRRSRVVRLALADGRLLGDQLFKGSLQTLRPVAGGNWWLGEESDGALSVWPASGRQPLFRFWSLMGNDWLVVDEEGRYDSSAPGDLDALSWVLSDAPRQALPLQAFMRDFYQPGLMQRHLAGEQFPAMASVAELQRTLPRIELTSVKPGRNGIATVTVEVDPQGTGDVTDLRLFRNGQLVGYLPKQGNGVFHSSKRKKSYRFEVALPSLEQPVEFSAYAFNADGVRSERANMELDEFDPVPASPRRAFVITVGVNRYQNPAFNLRYAANDARAYSRSFTAALDSTGNFDEVVHIPLISEPGSDGMAATRDNFAAVLSALAGNGEHAAVSHPADTNDSIIVTFSGHGYADEAGRFHFLLEDIGNGSGRQITEELLSNTFTSSDLERSLRDVDAQGIFLVIDACNSAASIAQGNFKPGPMGSKGLGQLAYDKAMMVITATQTEDVAMESQALEHGMLTYALVNEGIESGRADQLPADQSLWMRELFEYGQNRVPSLYREVIEQGGPQNGSDDRGLSAVKSSSVRERWLQQPSLFDFSREQDLLLDSNVAQ